jgi:transcriptional regulator GlxA family with amidase domain
MKQLALLVAALLAALIARSAPAAPGQRAKPVIAVIAANQGTEVTDFLVPFAVIADSNLAEVYAVALQAGPVMLHPSMTSVELPETAASFAALYPDGADYVIVPAMHMPDNPALATWLRDQQAHGATLMSVCDGAKVLAAAGLLAGHTATAHWYALKDLRRDYPLTQWRNDRRYIFDGNIVTTSGVSASLPATLALLEHIAGREAVQAYARQIGIDGWVPEHAGASFTLSGRAMRTAAINWLAFWNHQQLALTAPERVEEAQLAFVLDAYARTYRTKVSLQSAQAQTRSKHGLIFHASTPTSARQLDATILQQPVGKTLDAVLERIEREQGMATADFVALQLEYPRR